MSEKEKYNDLILEKTVNSLKNSFFDVLRFKNKNEALDHLISLIKNDSVIGFGGSATLEEIGFFEVFTSDKYPNLLDRRKPGLSPEKKLEIQRACLTADFYLCSVNALSQSGEIVMIDKWGNRSGAMTFGPKKRIFIAGVNKIEPDLEHAIYRAKNTSAVLNNIRFDTKNPCTKNGKCMDCGSTDRLCSVTTIIHRCQPPGSILVMLIEEELGF
jgi:hypothetical protein